jgi:hypothetical protein
MGTRWLAVTLFVGALGEALLSLRFLRGDGTGLCSTGIVVLISILSLSAVVRATTRVWPFRSPESSVLTIKRLNLRLSLFGLVPVVVLGRSLVSGGPQASEVASLLVTQTLAWALLMPRGGLRALNGSIDFQPATSLCSGRILFVDVDSVHVKPSWVHFIAGDQSSIVRLKTSKGREFVVRGADDVSAQAASLASVFPQPVEAPLAPLPLDDPRFRRLVALENRQAISFVIWPVFMTFTLSQVMMFFKHSRTGEAFQAYKYFAIIYRLGGLPLLAVFGVVVTGFAVRSAIRTVQHGRALEAELGPALLLDWRLRRQARYPPPFRAYKPDGRLQLFVIVLAVTLVLFLAGGLIVIALFG